MATNRCWIISLSGENDEKELTNELTGEPLMVGFCRPAEWPEKAAEWGGSVAVGERRVSIQLVQHILTSRFCFISGLKTDAGHPVMSFPDSRTSLSFEDYQLLVDYLVQLNSVESISPVVEHRCPTGNTLLLNNNVLAGSGGRGGFVLVVDRRLDKWSSVRNLFSYLMVRGRR
uniref:Uncharacterized protein n=1 Tax=Globodera pallida TaxID=36090 RepID=A0A183CJH7_GLOPA